MTKVTSANGHAMSGAKHMTETTITAIDRVIAPHLVAEIAFLRAALSDAIIVFGLSAEEAHRTKWWDTYADVANRAIKNQKP